MDPRSAPDASRHKHQSGPKPTAKPTAKLANGNMASSAASSAGQKRKCEDNANEGASFAPSAAKKLKQDAAVSDTGPSPPAPTLGIKHEPKREHDQAASIKQAAAAADKKRKRVSADGDKEARSLAPSGKKRQRDILDMKNLLKQSVVVKPHPVNLQAKPLSLQPLMVLPREHLRLSCLDLSMPHGRFEYARSYQSIIRLIDHEKRVDSRPVVLVARLETDKSVYALEAQDAGLYSLCKLGAWVDLEELSRHATVSCSALLKQQPAPATSTDRSESLLTTSCFHKEDKERQVAIEAIQALLKKAPRSASVSKPKLAPVLPKEQMATEQSHEETQAESKEVHLQWTAEEIFDNVRKQYFETLYRLKGSTAYFAKGPLSRARAAFHLDVESTLEMDDMIAFLRGLVVPRSKMEIKYRDTIPGIIADMKVNLWDEEELSTMQQRTRAKTIKLGRDGLYPTEKEQIREWWALRKAKAWEEDWGGYTTTARRGPDEAVPHLVYLRCREAQLQMIIMLEILSLESQRTVRKTEDSQLPGPSGEEGMESGAGKSATAKASAMKQKKAKFTLTDELELYVDRLIIWEATADESLPRDIQGVDQVPISVVDVGVNFSVEVLMPFYSARLPELSRSINSRLGGPQPIIQAKAKPVFKKPAVKAKAKPVAKRRAPPSMEALDRALSREEKERDRRSMSNGPNALIALMRARTIAPINMEASMLRREAINAVTEARRISTAEAKAKRDAQVRAELGDAILGARKPNRYVAGQAIAAEAADRRTTKNLPRSRKAKNPAEYGVVKATPVHQRFKDALGRKPGEQLSDEPTPSPDIIPATPPSQMGQRGGPGTEADASRRIAQPQWFKAPSGTIKSAPKMSSTSRRNFTSGRGREESVIPASPPAAGRNSDGSSLSIVPDSVPKSRFRGSDAGLDVLSSPITSDFVDTPWKNKNPGGSRAASTSNSRAAPSSEQHRFRDSGIGMSSSAGAREIPETPLEKTVPAAVSGAAASPAADVPPSTPVGKSRSRQQGAAAAAQRQLTLFQRLGWDDDDSAWA